MKLKVLGQIITVVKEPNLGDTMKANGLYYNEAKKIFIDADLKGDDYTQVLLHELFHAVIVRSGFYNVLEPQAEEVLVDSLATVLVENFKIKLKD